MTAPFILPIAFWLIRSVDSSLITAITRKEVMRAGKRLESAFIPLLALSLMIKILRGGFKRAGRWHNNREHMDKIFYCRSIL